MKTVNVVGKSEMSSIAQILKGDAYRLAGELFSNGEAGAQFAERLLDVCTSAEGKDFLVVHNPGGWGHARLEECLEWERSIIAGVTSVIKEMGYTVLLTQYFRSGRGWREQMRDLRQQFSFFSSKARVMAAWLRFVIQHTEISKVVLVGISQGAAFGSSVMRQLGGLYPVYSIELGFPFQYRSWRVITERTLAIESNGVRPDVLVQGDLLVGAKILIAAPFKWLWHRLRGRRVSLAHCVNAPGHMYSWHNPTIQRRIRDFLLTNFGTEK